MLLAVTVQVEQGYQGDYPARINEMFLNATRILHENGVKFILGTDTDNPYLVPGTSLLDELDYLVSAGFSPYEALETGTRTAAEAIGKSDEFGTIEAGKRADLILVLDDGAIVQRGTHDALLEQGGLYKEIYDLQLKDQEQFAREMMFLGENEMTEEERGNGGGRRGERVMDGV